MGRFPWGSDLVAVNVTVRVAVEPNDWDTPEEAEAEDDGVGRCGCGRGRGRGRVYLLPGCPGLSGSSRMLGFFDTNKTTRLISGLDFGSD